MHGGPAKAETNILYREFNGDRLLWGGAISTTPSSNIALLLSRSIFLS